MGFENTGVDAGRATGPCAAGMPGAGLAAGGGAHGAVPRAGGERPAVAEGRAIQRPLPRAVLARALFFPASVFPRTPPDGAAYLIPIFSHFHNAGAWDFTPSLGD